jgi:glycerol-3-phosphate acyltransferase PlsY
LDTVWSFALLAAILWLTHRANIARLLKGEEPKSSFSKKT